MSNNKATTILDRPFGDVLSERINQLPDEERATLYEAIDSEEPSDEALRLSKRIILDIFKEAYERDPEAFMEFIEQPTKPSSNGSK